MLNIVFFLGHSLRVNGIQIQWCKDLYIVYCLIVLTNHFDFAEIAFKSTLKKSQYFIFLADCFAFSLDLSLLGC